MSLELLISNSALKKLICSGINPNSLKIFCYLLDCLGNGAPDVLVTAEELAGLLQLDQKNVKQSISELKDCLIVHCIQKGHEVSGLRINTNVSQWQLPSVSQEEKKELPRIGSAENVSLFIPKGGNNDLEPLQFPYEIKGNHPLRAIDGGKEHSQSKKIDEAEVALEIVASIVEKFKTLSRFKLLDLEKELSFAKILYEDFPLNTVLELIETFGADLKSLGFIVGGWDHYLGLMKKRKHEVQQLVDFRRRQETANNKLRESAFLEQKKWEDSKGKLSADESLLLNILMKHEQPRRQFFWALQARFRYPQLTEFFENNEDLAAPGRR